MSSCGKPCVEGSSISLWPPIGPVTPWQPVALFLCTDLGQGLLCSPPLPPKCACSFVSHFHSVCTWKERGGRLHEPVNEPFTPFFAESDGLKPCEANQLHVYFSKGAGGGGESFPERTWP